MDAEVPCESSCWLCDCPVLSASCSVVRDDRIGSGRSPRPSPAVVIRMAAVQAITATMAMAIEKMMTFFCVWLRSAAALARRLSGATRAVVARPAIWRISWVVAAPPKCSSAFNSTGS